MPEWTIAALLALNLALLLWLVFRRSDSVQQPIERLERELRDEIGRQAQASRVDLGSLQQVLLTQSGDVARTQNEQIDSFRSQLAVTQQQMEAALRRLSDVLAEQLRLLSETNERRQAEMRLAVETRLQSLQEGNEKRLEQMRATVDEKLQSTLETRLGESFRLVSERLEHVQRGLGEMQQLATGVGDLKRVLGNVKSRGVFGEVQLAGLLEQVFAPDQYAANVATVPGSNERVEFAVRFPGANGDAPVWLPIDAKFPREDYERLLDAQESADAEGARVAGEALERRVKLEAQRICDKYVAAPHTTEFAILFLPTEGLYAEVLRRPGLVDGLQRDCRIAVAGPTTLLALMTSFQMGFRTLAIEKRSSEVWRTLGAVKTEFGKFGEVLDGVQKKLLEASNKIEQTGVRTRAIQRQLREVESLPGEEASKLLGSDPQ